MSRYPRGLAVVAACVFRMGLARAEDVAPQGVADALFNAARRDMQRDDCQAAVLKLAESQRMDPASGTLFNLMLCEERLGKIASAWMHDRELLEHLAQDDDRRPVAQARLSEIAARLPHLTVREPTTFGWGSTARPSGASDELRLFLDGVELRKSSLGVPLPVDPGVHRLVAVANGGPERTFEIAVEEGKQYEWPGALDLAVTPPPVSVPAPPEARVLESAPPPMHDAEAFHPPRWLGWTATAVGAAGILTGAVLGAVALHDRSVVEDVCPHKRCRDQSGIDAADEGKKFVIGSIAGFAFGVAGVGLGAYAFSTSSPDLGPHRTASSPAPFYGVAYTTAY